MTTEINIELDKKSKGDENKIIFDIKGNNETGLDKSIINGLRRVLLASIPTVAFSTRLDNSDLTIKKNDSPLHNEFLQDRIGLIPLYINPLDYQKQYLFRLQVENNSSEPVTTITANDFDIYPLNALPGIFWFTLKIIFILFLFIWVRGTFPRYRYDQLMRLGWKVFLPLSLLGVVVTSGFLVIFDIVPA